MLNRLAVRKYIQIVLFGFVLGFFVIVAMFLLGGTASAAGGVGSGGTGGGAGTGDEAHWADRGYGWVKYSTTGPGPSDGFRNGTSWSTAQNTCRDTRYVYAFIVYDNFAKGMIYSYEGWNNPANLLDSRFGEGASVDHGRAITMTIATARSSYGQISNPPYNVDTSGYAFDNGTMGWFCFEALPQEIPPNITGFNVKSCNAITVTATTDGHTYSARLLIDTNGDGIGEDTPILVTGIPNGASRDLDISSWKDFGTHDFYVRVRDDYPAHSNLTDTSQQPRRVGPCLKFKCSSPPITYSKNPIIAGDTFTATAGFGVVTNDASETTASLGSRGTPYNYYIRLQMLGFSNPYNPSQQIDSGTVSSGTSSVSATSGNITAPATLGTYDASSSIRNTPGGGNLVVCNGAGEDTVVSEAPIFHVLGGDVASAVSPAPGCPGWGISSNPLVALSAWNNSANGNVGAGTNLAALSGRNILGFASAQNRISFPQPLTGLSFSSFSLSGYGGNYPNFMPCPADYFGTQDGTEIPVDGSVNPNAIGNSARYDSNGSLTILGTGLIPVGWTFSGIPNGNRPIVYVEGDAYISGNILLQPNATTVAQMPNFYLVVRGNIYIAPGVQRLDGVYIAQPDSTNNRGKIYTCAFPIVAGVSWRAPTAAELSTTCRTNQLTVNGAFIAKELKLYRSFGSFNANNPAEKFNTTPATWLAAPCVISNCSGPESGKPVDSITSLPPIL